MACRIERRRQWAVRLMHENQLHQESCFLTLTYDDNNIPLHHSLNPKHFTDFMKRFREKMSPVKLRYYQCGEYGEQTSRPHHHALIFGYRPTDGKPIKRSGDHMLYRSESLSEIWGHGAVDFGEVGYKTASYVAGYVTKKINGEKAIEHYAWTDPETGEIHSRLPEYATMSRKPGIGSGWIERFASQTLAKDSIVVMGKLARSPLFYDNYLKLHYPQQFEQLKIERKKKGHQTFPVPPINRIGGPSNSQAVPVNVDPEIRIDQRRRANEAITKARQAVRNKDF
jgi:hypothetical protein